MKNILFDLDGTIINSQEGVTGSIAFALASVGIERPPMEQLKKCIGPPLTDSFVSVFGVKEEQLWDVMKAFRKRYETIGMFQCELYDGIADCIRALREDGYFIGLASSKNQTACRAILEHFHIVELFDDIVGSSEDASVETKEQVLELFLQRNPSCAREETILIGDTHFDVEGAKAASIACIGVSYGFGSKQELMESGATVVLDSAREVRDYFEAY